jgi:hypothetical protein
MNQLLFFLILLTSSSVLSCQNPANPEVTNETRQASHSEYLGSFYKGNFVWAGAMNLAWTELNENILKEKLRLNTQDEAALHMVEVLNNPVFTKNDLDEKSYYIKSGYGQKTVKLINAETRRKFPGKSFEDLALDLDDTDIISYAYFLKETEYKTEFSKGDVHFDSVKVSGFFAGNDAQKSNVKVLEYQNDDAFIIRLQLKNDEDQLILAKGFPMDTPQLLIDRINAFPEEDLGNLNKKDVFSCPSISLKHYREYNELINKNLLNKGFEQYFIFKMFENIKFDMDEKGARVENEAVIVLGKSAQIDDEEPRHFVLDKPYWIIMKRKDSRAPYFLLGINNVELMEVK